ncbi:hypothetical protein PoB_003494200 [Plakobranchus ocellatus]|uniref:Transposase n=1 Tax=Plakobranchus ocellatus TaxID=259542 RepID=A0AAV4AME2_9GAST|nr:hypothetical protein PoB_003494200 [Plakobranchus ocellatus]
MNGHFVRGKTPRHGRRVERMNEICTAGFTGNGGGLSRWLKRNLDTRVRRSQHQTLAINSVARSVYSKLHFMTTSADKEWPVPVVRSKAAASASDHPRVQSR